MGAVVTLADGVTSMKAGTARSSDATKMKMKMPNKCRATYLLIHTDVAEAAKARISDYGKYLLLLLLLLLHPFNGLFFRTTWVSRYQKGETSLDLNEARDGGVWR